MPKAKSKATIKRTSARMAKKKEKVEINEPVCKEEDLIGIGSDAPVIDLTSKKKATPTKSKAAKKSKGKKKKSSKKDKKSTKKERNKDDPWSNDDESFSDSDASNDWFEKFFEEKKSPRKQKAKKVVVVKKVEEKPEEVVPENVVPKEEVKPDKDRWTDDEGDQDIKDSGGSDASDDSFDKYFPKQEEEKPKKPRRKMVRLEYSMVQHLEGYEVESRIFCSICNSHFNQMPGHPQNYTDHIINIHGKAVGDDLYLCTYCNNTTPKSLKNLKVHLFRHREMAKPKVCTACGESFTDYNKWRCHMRMERSVNGNHPDKRIFPCESCGKICATNNSLQMHVINIHEKKGRKCRWCPRIVPYEEWEEHKEMEKIKNKIRVQTTCEICGTTFTSKDSAANHRRNFQ